LLSHVLNGRKKKKADKYCNYANCNHLMNAFDINRVGLYSADHGT